MYSLLAQTMQVPLAYLYLGRIEFPLTMDKIVPNITTGLEAFGKAGDLDKIKQYTEMMQLPNTWPQAVQERTKFDIYSREVALSLSMKLPWVMDETEWKERNDAIKDQQQQQMLMEAAKGAAPEMVKQIGGAAQNEQ